MSMKFDFTFTIELLLLIRMPRRLSEIPARARQPSSEQLRCSSSSADRSDSTVARYNESPHRSPPMTVIIMTESSSSDDHQTQCRPSTTPCVNISCALKSNMRVVSRRHWNHSEISPHSASWTFCLRHRSFHFNRCFSSTHHRLYIKLFLSYFVRCRLSCLYIFVHRYVTFANSAIAPIQATVRDSIPHFSSLEHKEWWVSTSSRYTRSLDMMRRLDTTHTQYHIRHLHWY